MGRGLFEPWHLILLVALVAVLFGWKKLPDITRSVGRSMRIFKSEVAEMKNDGRESRPSAAAGDTVPGGVVPPQQPPQPYAPYPDPTTAAPPSAYQPAPNAPAAATAPNGQSATDPAAEQRRYENPAL